MKVNTLKRPGIYLKLFYRTYLWRKSFNGVFRFNIQDTIRKWKDKVFRGKCFISVDHEITNAKTWYFNVEQGSPWRCGSISSMSWDFLLYTLHRAKKFQAHFMNRKFQKEFIIISNFQHDLFEIWLLASLSSNHLEKIWQ